MPDVARQLPFDLPPEVRLGADDFLVTSANRAAYDMIGEEVPWPDGKLLLHGPTGSGKSHLARVWQNRTGAVRIEARALAHPPALHRRAVVVEDLQHLPRGEEVALFNLHNRLRDAGGRLLMTADRPARRLAVALPDLRSRLEAAAAFALHDPDETLVLALLAKHFSDRRLAPPPRVLAFLAARIDRSHAAAARIVAALDRASLARQKPITVSLASEILAAAAAEELDSRPAGG